MSRSAEGTEGTEEGTEGTEEGTAAIVLLLRQHKGQPSIEPRYQRIALSGGTPHLSHSLRTKPSKPDVLQPTHSTTASNTPYQTASRMSHLLHPSCKQLKRNLSFARTNLHRLNVCWSNLTFDDGNDRSRIPRYVRPGYGSKVAITLLGTECPHLLCRF